MTCEVNLVLSVEPEPSMALEAEYISDTGDATATAEDILNGKTAYTASGKVTGTFETVGFRSYMDNAQELGPLTWAGASDEMLDHLLTLADNGEIDLYRDLGWRVGDTRTVRLAAMPAEHVSEAHVEQNVELTLVNRGGYQRSDGGGEVAFVWEMRNVLLENGYIHRTEMLAYGWISCDRRAWCNDTFYNALPEHIRKHVKCVDVNAPDGPNGIVTSADWCFLPDIKEVKRDNGDPSLWDYYNDVSRNALKASFYSKKYPVNWYSRITRVPPAASYQDGIGSNGSFTTFKKNTLQGISVAGCI